MNSHKFLRSQDIGSEGQDLCYYRCPFCGAVRGYPDGAQRGTYFEISPCPLPDGEQTEWKRSAGWLEEGARKGYLLTSLP